MTKHLRLLMLALLAIICTGGVKAAVGDTYKLVTSVDKLKAGDVIVIGCEQYAKAMGAQNTNNRAAVDITITNGVFSFVDGIEELTLKKVNEKWQLVTSDGKYLYQPDKNKLQSTDDASNTNTQASISFTSVGNSTICFGKFTSFIKLNINPYCFSCYASSTSKTYIVQIYKKQDSGKTDPEIAFKETEKTVELKEGAIKLSTLINNPHTLPVTYISSNDEVAEVSEGVIHMYKTGKVDITAKFAGNDTYNAAEKTLALTIEDNRADAGIHFEKDSYTADINKDEFKGAVLVNPNKLTVTYSITPADETALIDPETGFVIYTKGTEASYVVTAKFSGDDTYKPVTATYTLKIADPNYEVKTVTFDAKTDKGTTTNTNSDAMDKEGIYVTSTSAAFATGSDYRFYGKNTEHTFSVKTGKITKIEFIGNSGSNPLTNLKLKEENGTFASTKSSASWTGNSNRVIFTTIAQARATKITVTVKVPVAKDFTLDENKEVNEIEDWENSNVTVKRTFYKDGDWNTLCLPFDVSTEEVEKAFGSDAQLRQVDEANSKDNMVAFTTATAIKAGVPYLIKFDKLTENADQAQKFEYTFKGVEVNTEPAPVTLENRNIVFAGVYEAFTPEEFMEDFGGDVVASMAAANTLKRVNAGTTIKGLRAVFGLSSSVQPQAVKVVIDGTTTGIGDLHVDGASVANGRVYNLNGQCVGTSLEGLKAGVYIQNGKKVIINK